jgi:hypothetical protein
MLTARYSCAAAILVFGIGTAQGADPNLLAQTGGFLLGNAYRCGVPMERVTRAGTVISDMISAASTDADEAQVADARFRDHFVATARSDADALVLTPSCEAVLLNFKRLERHHREAGYTD